MTTETRTVHFTIAPRLSAYLAWLDKEPGRTFDLAQYDLFCANYREAPSGDVIDDVPARVWPGLDEGEGY